MEEKEENPRENEVWTTSLNEEIFVPEMETTHVQNTVLFLIRKQEACTLHNLGNYRVNDRTALEWIELLKAELQYREDKINYSLRSEKTAVTL